MSASRAGRSRWWPASSAAAAPARCTRSCWPPRSEDVAAGPARAPAIVRGAATRSPADQAPGQLLPEAHVALAALAERAAASEFVPWRAEPRRRGGLLSDLPHPPDRLEVDLDALGDEHVDHP